MQMNMRLLVGLMCLAGCFQDGQALRAAEIVRYNGVYTQGAPCGGFSRVDWEQVAFRRLRDRLFVHGPLILCSTAFLALVVTTGRGVVAQGPHESVVRTTGSVMFDLWAPVLLIASSAVIAFELATFTMALDRVLNINANVLSIDYYMLLLLPVPLCLVAVRVLCRRCSVQSARLAKWAADGAAIGLLLALCQHLNDFALVVVVVSGVLFQFVIRPRWGELKGDVTPDARLLTRIVSAVTLQLVWITAVLYLWLNTVRG